jgi:hypothetical protein
MRGTAGPRAFQLLAAGAGPHAVERRARHTHPLFGRALPFARQIDTGPGVVALLLRSGVGAEQRLEAIQIGLRALDLHVDGGNVARGGIYLRLGLAHVLAAGAGFEEMELRRRRGTLGSGASDLQLGVPDVERRNHVAGIDAVAFRDAELEHAAADLWGHLHFGGLHVAGRGERVRRRRLRARSHDDGHRHRESETYQGAHDGRGPSF